MVSLFRCSLPIAAFSLALFAMPCHAQDPTDIFANDTQEVYGEGFEHWLRFNAEEDGILILLVHNSSVDLGMMLHQGSVAIGRVDYDHHHQGNEAAVFQVMANHTYLLKVFALPGTGGLPEQFQATTTFVEGATIDIDFFAPGYLEAVPAHDLSQLENAGGETLLIREQ